MARLRLGVSAVVVCNPRLLTGAVYANVQAKLTDTAHEFFVRRAPETASIAADGGPYRCPAVEPPLIWKAAPVTERVSSEAR